MTLTIVRNASAMGGVDGAEGPAVASLPSLREPLLDAKEAGKLLGFSAPTMRKMAAAGQIPGHPYGLGSRIHWRFKLSELDAQQPRTVTSATQPKSATQE